MCLTRGYVECTSNVGGAVEHAWFWAVLFVLGMALVVFDVVRNRRRPLPPDKRRRSEQQAAVMLA